MIEICILVQRILIKTEIVTKEYTEWTTCHDEVRRNRLRVKERRIMEILRLREEG